MNNNNVKETATALYDFSTSNKEELSFLEGDILIILDKSKPGWWKAELNGKRGLIPNNYIQLNPTNRPFQLKGLPQKKRNSQQQAFSNNKTNKICRLAGCKRQCNVKNGVVMNYCRYKHAKIGVKLPDCKNSNLANVLCKKSTFANPKTGKIFEYCSKRCFSLGNGLSIQGAGASPIINPVNNNNAPPLNLINPLISNPKPSSGAPPGSRLCRLYSCKKPVHPGNDSNGKPFIYCSRGCYSKGSNLKDCKNKNTTIKCNKSAYCDQNGNAYKYCSRSCGRKKGTPLNNGPANRKIGQCCVVDKNKYKNVENQFMKKWLHAKSAKFPTPTVTNVLHIKPPTDYEKRFRKYQKEVEAEMNAMGIHKFGNGGTGNTHRRFHGTTRNCNLGINGCTDTCTDPTCITCVIIRSGFKIISNGRHKIKSRWGRGLYYTSTSSKSHFYAEKSEKIDNKKRKTRVMFLTYVVIGRGNKLLNDDNDMKNAGNDSKGKFHSVLGEVASGGVLNYDECVVYTSDAAMTAYLITYSFD
eukprot:TRINITY_DN7945_c5_g1_i1.p1 TRINITY_DN7945_c5_g1~~TRINITY_DN7945_c5_g1_i1.p1  ORF type:complete len:525 (+),score=159.93 TRINITY_DN7945_c5_g1_i1:161-1735(+)